MKRTKSKTASIFMAIANFAGMGFLGYMSWVVIWILLLASAIGGGEEGQTTSDFVLLWIIAGVLVLGAILAIVSNVFTFMSFSYIDGTKEKYAQKKNSLIALIVINFILVAIYCFAFSMFFNGSFSNDSLFIAIASIFEIIVITVSNILYLVDLKQERLRIEQTQTNQVAQTTKEN